jgi:hypothetical protein
MRHEEEFLPLDPFKDLIEALDWLIESRRLQAECIEQEGDIISLDVLRENEYLLNEGEDDDYLLSNLY